jgi:cardiolipin synthase
MMQVFRRVPAAETESFMWMIGQAETLLLWVVHVTLAACVTGHVLLTKRDVGASTAWIGLSWLSPIVGSFLYALLGINRVRTRAISLKTKVADRKPGRRSISTIVTDNHLSPLELTVSRITGRKAEEGNAVTILQNGDEAYPRMLAAIDAAQTSVALSTYIFRLDEIGRAFVDALTRAHRRGVAVRVIVDGIGSGYLISPAYWKLRRGGVPAGRFLHSVLPWRMPFLNLRTHKKLLCVDGRRAFTGGLNIGDENRLQTHPPFPVRDTHFLFEGPVVAQLNDAFADDWLFVAGEQLSGEHWFPSQQDAGAAVARVITSGPDQDVEKIESVILQAVACARTCIRIVTPYFLSDDRLVTSLVLASIRGIAVDIMVPRKNNHRLMQWATGAQIGALLEAGCRVWSNPPPFDHSKILTVDGIWGLIGSANWDMRSFRLNFELDVEIYHPPSVQQLDGLLAAKQGRLLTLAELRARPLPLRLRDSAARLLLPYL